ncbi:MAG: hypothetical protein AAGC88_00700, partial [Bacteroidota bacterium]
GGWFVHTLDWVEGIAGLIFNLPVLVLIVVIIYLSRKEALQHLLWIMIMAHFLFEYPFPHSLW